MRPRAMTTTCRDSGYALLAPRAVAGGRQVHTVQYYLDGVGNANLAEVARRTTTTRGLRVTATAVTTAADATSTPPTCSAPAPPPRRWCWPQRLRFAACPLLHQHIHRQEVPQLPRVRRCQTSIDGSGKSRVMHRGNIELVFDPTRGLYFDWWDST